MDECLHCGQPIGWIETTFSQTGWMWMHREHKCWVVQCRTSNGDGPVAEPTPLEQVAI